MVERQHAIAVERQHGERAAYEAGCICPECRRANAERIAQNRDRRAKQEASLEYSETTLVEFGSRVALTLLFENECEIVGGHDEVVARLVALLIEDFPEESA